MRKFAVFILVGMAIMASCNRNLEKAQRHLDQKHHGWTATSVEATRPVCNGITDASTVLSAALASSTWDEFRAYYGAGETGHALERLTAYASDAASYIETHPEQADSQGFFGDCTSTSGEAKTIVFLVEDGDVVSCSLEIQEAYDAALIKLLRLTP